MQVKRTVLFDSLFLDKGQLTVEFAVIAPVAIVVAFICAILLMFISEITVFDISAHNIIAKQADRSIDEVDVSEIAAEIAQAAGIAKDRVVVETTSNILGHITYKATLSLRAPGSLAEVSVFGVGITPLTHSTELTISSYRKGVIK
ncbi:MAG: hypothetical protein IJV62_03405 [Eggerthellaceae bacterium]|nr:hypothetical protein [Eggerthellaceae bacterium]